MQNNIVEYFSGHEGYKCGYCKSTDTNFSHGMWAHSITPSEYESMLNRGWRRSGKYLYKPSNHLTCCPSYTINCHALDFHISKSQRKVLRKFSDHLLIGNNKVQKVLEDTHKSDASDRNMIEVVNYQEGIASATDMVMCKSAQEVSQQRISIGKIKRDIQLNSKSDEIKPKTSDSPKRRKSESFFPESTDTNTSTGSTLQTKLEGAKSKGQKAKQIRIERKRQKLISQGLNPDEVLARNKKYCPKAKEIEEFLAEDSNAKLKLKIRMVKIGTQEFESTFALEHSLYEKYQMKIHDDDLSECTPKKFKRFLCDNPINEVSGDDLGCYHQQYFLDDQLIAVGVVDILPTCLSSVYFFYDPVFMDLTLGTFGALREIAFVRQRAKVHPDFKFYYMGFYIHSCMKMRYKGHFTPSYLLCPETYKWKLLEDELREKLNQTKYMPFYTPANTPRRQENIDKVNILYRRNIMPYAIYELQRSKDDTKEIQEYCNLVGEGIANALCLYRSLN